MKLKHQVRLLAMLTRLRAPLPEGMRALGGFAELPEVLEAGGRFSELSDAPMARAMLESAETSPHPELLLAHLGEFLEEADRLRRQVNSLLLYPRLVLMALLLELLVITGYVFPAVFRPMAAAHPELGLAWLLGTPLPLLVALAGTALIHGPLRGRLELSPRGLGQRADQCLWCRALAHLLACGHDLPAALRLAAPVLASGVGAGLADEVARGGNLAAALARSGFDPLVEWAVQAGEARQQLVPVLEDAAGTLEQEVHQVAELRLRMVEPLSLLLLSLPVALVVVSFWLPFYWLVPQMAH